MRGANHGTRWTQAEDEFLETEWDGSYATTAVIADLLGRTVNATAQRHYELTWGTAADPVAVKPLPGEGRPAAVVRTTTTTTTVFVVDPADICPCCWQVKSVSGDCGCDC